MIFEGLLLFSCGEKMRSVKRTVLSELPNTLIVQLKRFEFDFEQMVKLKVYDEFEFPIDELGMLIFIIIKTLICFS